MQIRMIVAGAVLAAFCAAGPAGGARVLALLPHPGRSHFMVFEPLLEELAARGHRVTVVSFFPREPGRALPGYHDISLVGIIDIFQEVIPLSMFEPSPFGLDRFGHLFMLKMLTDWAVKICEKLQHWPPLQPLYENPRGSYDVVIVEMFNSACPLGLAHATGAPIIGITSHQDLTWWTGTFGQFDNPSYVPNVLLPFDQNMTLLERVANTATMAIQKVWFDWACWRETGVVRERLGTATPSLCELRRSLSLELLNTHHSLNGRYERPPSTIEVGGLHLRSTANASLSQDLEAIVSRAEAGVIVFSLGSMVKATTLPKEKREIFLRVFARTPQTVLWKYEDPSSLKDLPPNVHAISWLPQRALLNISDFEIIGSQCNFLPLKYLVFQFSFDFKKRVKTTWCLSQGYTVGEEVDTFFKRKKLRVPWRGCAAALTWCQKRCRIRDFGRLSHRADNTVGAQTVIHHSESTLFEPLTPE
ncbi:Ecdysteroid UDP-glucosyltransferase [Eumeta japonica]|uniref:Ecdysteroid UDP-glucosyltransferase n=1 Tax=Eumeta variegata TaxID=151549 RepID=A0A4C1YFG7_EUMVA|nr:Ecdysteroid UDP-glucosyltransferase [Eumeta japonica]